MLILFKHHPLHKVLEERHAREISQEAPRFLVCLNPSRVQIEVGLVIEELDWVGVQQARPAASLLLRPVGLLHAVGEVLEHLAEELKEVASTGPYCALL